MCVCVLPDVRDFSWSPSVLNVDIFIDAQSRTTTRSIFLHALTRPRRGPLSLLSTALISTTLILFTHVHNQAKRPPAADVKLRDAVASVVDKLTGDFREHIRRVPNRKEKGASTVEINVDSFISSKPKAYHRARALLAASQSLRSCVHHCRFALSFSEHFLNVLNTSMVYHFALTRY